MNQILYEAVSQNKWMEIVCPDGFGLYECMQ